MNVTGALPPAKSLKNGSDGSTIAQLETAEEVYIHVPMPGDHYSGSTGSATMAVIYELSRQHALAGGRTRVIVGRGTRHDYPVGECVEVEYGRPPTKGQKLLDAGLAALGISRRFEAAIYSPAGAAIDREFDGPIFLHNCPGAIPSIKRRHRRATVCLYAVNALFRTYAQAEISRTIRSADRVICCSEFIAGDLIARLGHDSKRVRVVENGIDTAHFSPAPCRTAEEIPTVLFLGRAVPEKGPDLLIQAALKVYASNRRFKLRIVGSKGYAPSRRLTPYEVRLRRLAAPLGDAIEFQPSIDRERLLEEYRSASVFCVPSNWDDPFPLTVLEAMACGLPVIASRRGGIPEAGGDAIQYFDPPDIGMLADRLAGLIDDPEARVEWGRRGRARVERFTWDNQYQKLRKAVAANES